MSGLSDTLTMGLVLVLLFGSIALYLYTRIQQIEQKTDLLESIVLNLKMDSEVKDFPELPAGSFTSPEVTLVESTGPNSVAAMTVDEYKPFEDTDDIETDEFHTADELAPTNELAPASADESELYKSVIDSAVKGAAVAKVSVNYEAMTLKELQALAKQRNIIGVSSMKKPQVLEALKTSERAISNVEPGSSGNSSFLDGSASLEELE